MRNLYFIIGITLILISCEQPEHNKKSKKASGNRIEITPFIKTLVVLRDTAQVKNVFAKNDSGRISMYNYNFNNNTHISYLNQDQFMVIKNAMMQMMHDPGTLVYDNIFAPPLTKEDVTNRLVMCDSVVESNFDAKGIETMTKRWLCDSVSLASNINMIQFYEAWYFNPDNRMIEKDLLGYTVLTYVEYREAYKSLFTVLKNEEAVKLFQKKYSW